MAASPRLQRSLQQNLGAEAAVDLLVWMESMDAHRTDLSEFRREMQAGFARIEERFAKVDERFDKVDARFDKLDEKFEKRLDAMDTRLGGIDVELTRLDGRIDTMQASMGQLMERGLREQTQFFFLAWAVLLAAIVGLYSRS